MKRNFRLQQTALMLALAAAYPVLGYAAAGTTQFTAGDVTVKRGNAAPAPLAKGAAVESGDSIVTGARGVAQLKFSDGGYVAIQPNSQFDLTRYADTGNTSQDNFLVGLARGGMRAITGLIGKRNTANYKVTTNTATVGIRGSAFNLAYNADGTLSVATEQDAIEVCTAAGCIGLTAGESALVPNNQSLPIRTDVRSTMPTAPYRQDPVVAGNQVNEDGTAAILPVVPRVFTGIAFAGAGLVSGEGTYANVFGSADGALTVQGGRPTNYLGSDGGQGALSEGGTTEVHYTQGSLQTGDYLVLGTWSSGTWDSGESSSYLHTPLAFVAGVPTSSAAISNLYGSSATYSLRAASPVYSASGFVGTLNSADLGIDFTTGAGNIDLSVGMNYQGQYGSGSAIYSYNGQVYANGSRFYSYIYGSGSGYVEGFFSGSGAEHAGISYGAGTQYNGEIAGAAILGRDTLTTPPVTITGNYAGGIAYNSGEGIYSEAGMSTSVDLESAGSSHVVGFHDSVGAGYENRGTVTTHYVVGQPSESLYLNLGTWSGSRFVDGGESSYDYGVASYVVGTATDSTTIASLSGQTGTYSLLSASPIHMSNGETGSLNTANLSVNFGGGSGGTNIGNISLGMTLGTSGSHTLSGSVAGTGATFSGSGLSLSGGEGGYGQVDGFFSGNSAEYAGIVYSGFASLPGASFGGAAILSGGVSGVGFAPQAGTYTSGLVSTFSAVASDQSAWYSNFPNQAFGTEHTFSTGAGDTFLSEAKTGAGLPSVTYGGGSATFNYTGTMDSATPDFIGWGTWSSGSATYSGGSVGLSNVHYVVGAPTPQADMIALNGSSATLTYSVAGGTAPTSTLGGTGSLDTATLTANFGNYTASASVVTKFGGNLYPITVNGMSIDQATATFNGTMGNDRMTGLFVGPMASKAGISYTSTTYSGTLGTITGAAVFNQVQPN